MRRTTLTKFERVKVIGMRAEQLTRGAQPLIKLDDDGVPLVGGDVAGRATTLSAPIRRFDPYFVAEKELEAGVLPLLVVRTMPDGKTDVVRSNDTNARV